MSSTIDGQFATSGWTIPPQFGRFLSGVYIPYAQNAMQVGIECDVAQGIDQGFRSVFARVAALGNALSFVFERITGFYSVQ